MRSKAAPLLQALKALAVVLAAMLSAHAAVAQASPTPSSATGASGLPVPRYVSLKSDRVNLRKGPSTDYPTSWVYRRAGLPLEVIAEHEGWRQVRDSEGTTGWVLQSFLSGRRTALIMPWEVKGNAPTPQTELKDDDSERARPVAILEAGLIASVITCDGRWCRITVGQYRGWIEQKKLWGVYEGEVVK